MKSKKMKMELGLPTQSDWMDRMPLPVMVSGPSGPTELATRYGAEALEEVIKDPAESNFERVERVKTAWRNFPEKNKMFILLSH